jgi:hypothetical protein
MRTSGRNVASQPRSVRKRRVAASSSYRTEDAHFLNIDLDVRSRRSLGPLVAAWPWAYQPLVKVGRPNSHWLILNAGILAKTAEVTARRLLDHIEDLRGDARRCWRGAHRRTFDIGLQAGGPGTCFEDVRLTTRTLRRIASAGAQLQITVYPAQPDAQVARPVQSQRSPARGRNS